MLMRFDPFAELDRLVQQRPASMQRASIPLDAYRDGDHVIAHFDLPGVDPDSIDLTVEKNVLTVRAERRWEQTESQELLIIERPQGTFSRQLFLGEGLDPERVEARYEQGVLTVQIPVAERAKPRKVQIGGGEGAQTIEASSTES